MTYEEEHEEDPNATSICPGVKLVKFSNEHDPFWMIDSSLGIDQPTFVNLLKERNLLNKYPPTQDEIKELRAMIELSQDQKFKTIP